MNDQMRGRLDRARRAVEEAQRKALEVERDVLRLELIAIADEYPQVDELGFRSSWEYDDEGSYYWADYTVVRTVGSDDLVGYDEVYYLDDGTTGTKSGRELMNDLERLDTFGHDAWREAIPGSDDDGGSIKVADLRQLEMPAPIIPTP